MRSGGFPPAILESLSGNMYIGKTKRMGSSPKLFGIAIEPFVDVDALGESIVHVLHTQHPWLIASPIHSTVYSDSLSV